MLQVMHGLSNMSLWVRIPLTAAATGKDVANGTPASPGEPPKVKIIIIDAFHRTLNGRLVRLGSNDATFHPDQLAIAIHVFVQTLPSYASCTLTTYFMGLNNLTCANREASCQWTSVQSYDA